MRVLFQTYCTIRYNFANKTTFIVETTPLYPIEFIYERPPMELSKDHFWTGPKLVLILVWYNAKYGIEVGILLFIGSNSLACHKFSCFFSTKITSIQEHCCRKMILGSFFLGPGAQLIYKVILCYFMNTC